MNHTILRNYVRHVVILILFLALVSTAVGTLAVLTMAMFGMWWVTLLATPFLCALLVAEYYAITAIAESLE